MLDENTDPDFFYAVVTAALGTKSRHDFERLIGLYETGYRGKGRRAAVYRYAKSWCQETGLGLSEFRKELRKLRSQILASKDLKMFPQFDLPDGAA